MGGKNFKHAITENEPQYFSWPVTLSAGTAFRSMSILRRSIAEA